MRFPLDKPPWTCEAIPMKNDDITRWRQKTTLNPLTGCWEWTAGTDYKGYGNFSVKNRTIKAHRYGYLALVGPIKVDYTLDHRTCRNTSCVNPGHMEEVSRPENSRRAAAHRSTWRTEL